MAIPINYLITSFNMSIEDVKSLAKIETCEYKTTTTN